MAISNKFGLMVVTTGNKSEMSAGYATLYGDMNGASTRSRTSTRPKFYRLSRLRNGWKPEGARPSGRVIPENVIVRAPPRNCARTRPTRTRCRLTTCSTRSWSGWWSASSRSPPSPPPVRSRPRPAHRTHAQHFRIQAPPGSARREGDAEEFRPRPPLSHHQSVSRPRSLCPPPRPPPGASRQRASRSILNGEPAAGAAGPTSWHRFTCH